VLVQAQRVAARIHSAHRGRLDAVPVLHRPNLVSVSRRLRVTRRLIYFQDGMSTKCNQFQNVLRFVRGHHPSAWSEAASQVTDWVKPRRSTTAQIHPVWRATSKAPRPISSSAQI
jgi:hypothetical protein